MTVLLCSGTKGKRFALPNSRVMIHQPWGGLGGDSSLMQIQSKEIENLKKIMLSIMSKHTGKVLKQIEKDCDRDHWMNAEDSKKYGMVDIILGGKKQYGL
jgi:ATP-dependent Clp protease protease subunit